MRSCCLYHINCTICVQTGILKRRVGTLNASQVFGVSLKWITECCSEGWSCWDDVGMKTSWLIYYLIGLFWKCDHLSADVGLLVFRPCMPCPPLVCSVYCQITQLWLSRFNYFSSPVANRLIKLRDGNFWMKLPHLGCRFGVFGDKNTGRNLKGDWKLDLCSWLNTFFSYYQARKVMIDLWWMFFFPTIISQFLDCVYF